MDRGHPVKRVRRSSGAAELAGRVRRPPLCLALAALGAGVALWAAALMEPAPAELAATIPVQDEVAQRVPVPQRELASASPYAQLDETPNGESRAADVDRQTHDAPATSAPTEHAHGEHPHPITPEHRRLQLELQLVAAMNDALDRRDGPALRGLVETYRAHDPGDEHGLQAGYTHLADCLEHPGEVASAAARDYYERERASTLRRYIRRTCLE